MDSTVYEWLNVIFRWTHLAAGGMWTAIKNQSTGAAISFVRVAVFAWVLSRFMSGRAVYIHVGGLFGTIMAANVWMRIWPSQRKIIAGVKGTAPAPDPSVPALAG